MLPTQVVRHEAECVKQFHRQPGLREYPGTSPASQDLWTGCAGLRIKIQNCLTVHSEKVKFDNGDAMV